MNFFRHLMEYSLSICKYYSTLTIVLTIVTNNTSQALADQTYECPEFPYAKNLPCTGWAKACFLINKQTITNHLKNKPLEVMVALAHFLIEGKPALINMEWRDDQTIQTLYRIAKRIISPEIVKEETNSAAFEELYFCAFDGLNRTKEILLENQNIETTTKRAIDCLDDHMTALNEIHRKRFAATSSDLTGTITPDHATALTTKSSETNVVSMSSHVNVSTMPIKENDTTLTQSASVPTSSSSHDTLAASSSAAIMPNASTVSIPISTRGTTRDLKRRMQQENWEFVDAYRTEHGSNMDWEQCFVQGKEKGQLQEYTTAKSAKACNVTRKKKLLSLFVCEMDTLFPTLRSQSSDPNMLRFSPHKLLVRTSKSVFN